MTALEKEMTRSIERLAGLQADIRSGRLRKRTLDMGPRTRVAPAGVFFARVLDPDGHIDRDWFPLFNGATYDGLNDALEVVFRAGTQRTAWYAGLISSTSFTGVSVNDTMASHSGWSEATGYTEGTRRQWSPAAAAAGILSNATVMTFTNGGSSMGLQGIFISTDNTKAGTTGKLWATAPDAAPRTLAASQTFQVIYEVDLVPQ